MAYGVIAHTVKQAGADHTTVTTDPLNTTSADSLFVVVSDFTSGTPMASWLTDSAGNSFGLLSGTSQENTANTRIRVYYAKDSQTGASHTFTYTAAGGLQVYPTILVLACSGGHLTAITDQENGLTTGGASSLATGSITPSEDNELVVTGVSSLDGGTMTAPSGFTLADQGPYMSGNGGIGGALAYKIQTTAAAVNPSWGFSSSTEASAFVASFHAAAGVTPPAAPIPGGIQIAPVGFQ
jgi:hypothetical protein